MRALAFLPVSGPCGCVRCFWRALLLERELLTDPRYGIRGPARTDAERGRIVTDNYPDADGYGACGVLGCEECK